MQIFVRARMKILSKSKVAQVFLFFLYPPPPTHQQQHPGLTPSAYWRFDFFHIFFLPAKSHRLVESKTVKGMFATRLGNTCPRALPIVHQTHGPADGREPGWRPGRLNSIRTAVENSPGSLTFATVCTGPG